MASVSSLLSWILIIALTATVIPCSTLEVLLYAWLIILTMVGLNYFGGRLQKRHKAVNTFLLGVPRLLVKDGKILEENLAKEHLRREELFALLREKEIDNTGEVQYIFPEQTGHVGLFRRKEGD